MVTQNAQKDAPQQHREQSSPMQCAGDMLSDPMETVKEYPVTSALIVFGVGFSFSDSAYCCSFHFYPFFGVSPMTSQPRSNATIFNFASG